MKLNVLIFILVVGNVLPMSAQKKVDADVIPYRRSSLHTIMIETDAVFTDEADVLLNEMVMSSYKIAPFPSKYNDHRLPITNFRALDFMSKEAIKEAKKENKSKEKGNKQRGKDVKFLIAIDKFIDEGDVARQMVGKWFNRQEDGAFDMSVIHDRGSYDATQMEAQIASGSIRGLASLKDAGEELIKNTFVVINKMSFVKNEPIALIIKETAYAVASGLPDMARMITEAAANATYLATKDGYSVWTVSFLYQLEWNDDIANEFYMNMWMDKSSIDEERKNLFETSDIFKLNYLGYEKAKSLVLIGVGKETHEIIQVATIRNVDKVYTKLQKSHEVFKTKTPVYSVDPIVAKIGMKEGISGGDKFDVLEMVYNQKTGLTEYKVVTTIKADKKFIWDNRYNMEGAESSDKSKLNGTQFKGKKVMAGMLLRQVK